MPSAIDPSQPPALAPTTAGVRANFLAAKNEIDTLQLALAGANRKTDDLGNRYRINQVAGQAMMPQCAGGVTVSAVALSAANLRMYPFICPSDGTLDNYKINITTVGAGNCRIGIYDEDPLNPGMPGLALDQSPEITQNALGVMMQACAVPVLKGQRLFLLHHSVIAATYTSLTALQMPVPYPPAAATFTSGRNMGSIATAYAPLPADASGLGWTLALSTAPMIGVVIS